MDGGLNTGILCLAPSANTPGKADATTVFVPAARAFARFHGYDPAQVVKFFDPGQTYPGRRAACNAALRALRVPIHTLMICCHGFRRGLQAGYLLANLGDLAELLLGKLKPGGHVLLYACDTGRDGDEETQDDRLPGPGGDGGFADGLRDACEAQGLKITVMGHTTRGHAVENPHARFFAAGLGGHGGDWYVDPKLPHFRRWQRALQDEKNTLRWRFPYMTPAQIQAELTAVA